LLLEGLVDSTSKWVLQAQECVVVLVFFFLCFA